MADSDFKVKAEYGSVVPIVFHFIARPYAVWMGFGARLAATRKLLGMTQSDLGRGLGTDGVDVGKQVVSGWEKDQHYPRVDQLVMICKKLKVSSDWLLFGEEAAGASKQYKAAQAADAEAARRGLDCRQYYGAIAAQRQAEAAALQNYLQRAQPQPAPRSTVNCTSYRAGNTVQTDCR